MKHLNKQPSQRSVLLVELDTRAHRSDVLRKKQLLREKYTTPIYIHAAKSQTELKMERNTKSLLNMIPDALRTHKVTYDGYIRELQHRQYNPYRSQSNTTTNNRFNQTNNRVNPKSQNNYRYDRRAPSEHKQQPHHQQIHGQTVNQIRQHQLHFPPPQVPHNGIRQQNQDFYSQ